MAMNKAERLRIEALETELAFRWPTAPKPKPMGQEDISANLVEMTPKDQSVWKTRRACIGWFYNYYSGTVSQGWSDGTYHSHMNVTGDCASRGMGQIYRTKDDALLAMRWDMCAVFANRLRDIDKQIQGGGE